MSKNWYPIINYENCTECGACVEFCSHGVHDKDKAPTPYVINPEGCIEGCKGCAGVCPVDAITYFGDNEEAKSGECCCGGNCGCESDEEAASGCGCGCESDEEATSDCGCDDGCDCDCGCESDEEAASDCGCGDGCDCENDDEAKSGCGCGDDCDCGEDSCC